GSAIRSANELFMQGLSTQGLSTQGRSTQGLLTSHQNQPKKRAIAIMKRKFAVIGLGRFGSTIALELARLGHEVLGVDQDRRRIDEVVDQVTHAVIADAEDEKALRELDISSYDAVVVAIGENIEANILSSLVVKSLGVKEVWAKAISHNHHKILAK